MRNHISLVLSLTFAALLLVPATALAQDVSDEKLQEFEQHIAQGAEFYKANDYQNALEQFRSARQIVDHPKLSYKIGRTLEKLNRCAKAKRAYERYLSYEGLDDSDRKRGKEKLAGLEKCKPLGHLELTCLPSDASIAIDERALECPAEIELESGTYTLQVSAPGYVSKEVSVEVPPKETTERMVDLTDSEDTSTGDPKADTGGGGDWMTYAKWGGIGVGGGLLLGGLASDYSAVARNDEIVKAKENNDAEKLDQLTDEAKAAQTRTVILYISGATLLAGGITLFVLDTPQTESEASLDDERPHSPRAGLRLGVGRIGAFLRW